MKPEDTKTAKKHEATEKQEAAERPASVHDLKSVEEELISKLRKVNARAVVGGIQRCQIRAELFPSLSFIWVYDRPGSSLVPQYRAMGYEVFTLPSGMHVSELSASAVEDKGRVRLDDTILMFTTKERVAEIMDAINAALRGAKLDQTDVIRTGTGERDDPLPAGVESEFELTRGGSQE